MKKPCQRTAAGVNLTLTKRKWEIKTAPAARPATNAPAAAAAARPAATVAAVAVAAAAMA
jgi:hypothetical protein